MVLPTSPSIAPLLAHPVAIFGGGVSGDGVRALLAAAGADGVVYDARGTEFGAAGAARHRLVVFSPGFPPDHPWLARARAAGLVCLGELDFASLFWHGRIVAVTGTNGKTTLTEFLTHALRSLGREVHATGNIGHPFSRLAADRKGGEKNVTAVCEVSSFQAETLKHFQANATLWTNFAEDHLERHPGLEAYFAAKWTLVSRTDRGAAFIGSSVARFAAKYDRPLAGVVAVATEQQPRDAALDGTVFSEYPQRENFLLALAWWRHERLDESALYAAARTFQLGRHRMTRVAEVAGVTYWNDSKATNFHAVEAALDRFTSPVVLIAGGKAKGGDLSGFVHRIAPRVHHVVLLGATSTELAFHCATFRVAHTLSASLAEAVRRAAELAPRGGHVLLSPGFASFDQFRNYEDRGEQFENLVRELALDSGGPTAVSRASLR
ncbi:MAG TPA: UDP-N-acetylmuramoyl-L-alanine--D-glutamate ligase [Opitutaceae bacterium]|nr:UDP-N-acetylmuramoyl-L-alanine--D-glutamate ligase [Opitutaceae bacterium]